MKKIMMFLMLVSMMVFSNVSVLAQNGNGNVPDMDRSGVREIIQQRSEVNGLENAMLRVHNQEAQQRLEQVLSMIQEQTRERLNRLNNLVIEPSDTVTERYNAEGLTEARFLGVLPVQKQVRYTITNVGEVAYIPSFLDALFVYNQPVNNVR